MCFYKEREREREREGYVSRNYCAIWSRLQEMPASQYAIPNLTMVTQEENLRFACHKSIAEVKTNYVYHKLIDRCTWMVECVNMEW